MGTKTIGQLGVAGALADADKVAVEQSGVANYMTLEELIEFLGTPAGTISAFGGAAAPDGWLLCDGSAVSRSTYARLFTAIGTTWGVGDGSTTFNLPDMRGAAPAGVGTSTGYTQNETVALGTKYNDSFQGHAHNGTAASLTTSTTFASGIVSRVQQGAGGDSAFSSTPATLGANGTPRYGTVTKGKTVGVNFIIKI